MRISDWSSDVCSSDLTEGGGRRAVVLTDGVVLEQRAFTVLAADDEAALHDLGEHQDGGGLRRQLCGRRGIRSAEHTSELQSLMRISYAVFCLKKKSIQAYSSENTFTHTPDPFDDAAVT